MVPVDPRVSVSSGSAPSRSGIEHFPRCQARRKLSTPVPPPVRSLTHTAACSNAQGRTAAAARCGFLSPPPRSRCDSAQPYSNTLAPPFTHHSDRPCRSGCALGPLLTSRAHACRVATIPPGRRGLFPARRAVPRGPAAAAPAGKAPPIPPYSWAASTLASPRTSSGGSSLSSVRAPGRRPRKASLSASRSPRDLLADTFLERLPPGPAGRFCAAHGRLCVTHLPEPSFQRFCAEALRQTAKLPPDGARAQRPCVPLPVAEAAPPCPASAPPLAAQGTWCT